MADDSRYQELIEALSTTFGARDGELNSQVLHSLAYIRSAPPLVRFDMATEKGTFFAGGLMSSAALISSWDSLYKEVRMEHAMLCLSDKADDLLMWSHYAENGVGFVVAINADLIIRAFQRASAHSLSWGRVTYTNKRPQGDFATNLETATFFTKPLPWHYEQEWRLVATIDHPYFEKSEGLFLAPLPRDAIVRIIIGPRATQDGIKAARQFAEQFGAESSVMLMEEHGYALKESMLDI
jgi:hypothetical protein